MINKFIVTTTISSVTEATKKYSELSDWQLIVVGDLKTPEHSYKDINCIYISPQQQEKKWKKLSDLIGWNCAERKNIGILDAYERGANIIAIVDDDNVPLDNWGKNLIIGKEVEVNYYETDRICFDPLYHTNYPHLWHRGYPLQLLSRRHEFNKYKKIIIPDIQSGLWNREPDIDSICRMEHSPNCVFSNESFPIACNTFSPFNSQNTILSRKAAEEYFMMCNTGRMTDIWASFYLQACGFRSVYTEADVRHDRHTHDATKDFKDEILGNLNTLSLLEDIRSNPLAIEMYIPTKTFQAFQEYKKIIGAIK